MHTARESDAPTPIRRPRWPWLVLAGLMLLMLGLRIFPGWSHLVKPDGEFRLADPDGYYHFRQAAYTVEHFPRLQRWDDFSHYPAVQRNLAAGLYDLALAGAAKFIGLFGVDPIRALWWICLLFPPLAATGIMALVYQLVRRQGTVAIGLAMALWYLLLPGLTLANVTIGIPDHHVIEMLVGVVSILLLQRLVERERARATAWWRPTWAALPLVLLQFTWLGGPLILGIFGLTIFGQLAADVLAGARAHSLVRAGIRYWLTFLALTGGTGLLLPDLVLLPQAWIATLAGAGGMLATLAAAGWFLETHRLPLRPGGRLALGAGLLTVLAGLLFAFAPAAREYVQVALAPKSLVVAEHQVVTLPLYFGVTGLAGLLGLLAPLAGILFGLWRRPAWWIGVLPSLLFIALWYRTYDYGYQGALHAVLLTGYFFSSINVRLDQKAPSPRGRSTNLWLAAATIAVLICLWPARWTAPVRLENDWYENYSGLPHEGWIEAMRWMRTATPAPPPRRTDAAPGQPPRGRVGVLTDWNVGQFVNTLAGHPATDSAYPGREGIAPFFLTDEAAVRAASMRGSTVAAAVRYVAIDPRTISEAFLAHRETLGLSAHDFYGRTSFRNAAGEEIAVPTLGSNYENAFASQLLINDANGLSHFRLVFESTQQSFLRLTCDTQSMVIIPRSSLVRGDADRAEVLNLLRIGLWKEDDKDAYLGHLIAAVKIFEQVPGATVEGSAPPGATVTLTTPLRLRTTGRVWHHRVTSRSGADGRFRLTTPYPTQAAPHATFEPAGPALLQLAAPGGDDEQTIPLHIPESAVQAGGTISWRGWLGQP